jgi:hypothetical protein
VEQVAAITGRSESLPRTISTFGSKPIILAPFF